MLVIVASLAGIVAAACGRGNVTGGNETPTSPAGGHASTEAPAAAVTEKDFDRRAFGRSTVIDNPWLPLGPGTQLVFEGRVTEGRERIAHRVVITVTDLTKVIDGVRTVVVWDRDYDEGHLVEGELAFFAQDDGGNVWALGEYPEEYEEGAFVGAPDTWIAGLEGAGAGVIMRAAPRTGTPTYLEGWAPEIHFADIARVLQMGAKNCVPLGCYEDVLVIDESDPAEPLAHQLKYYAAGVGNIRVGASANDPLHETLVLVHVLHLDPSALAEIRAGALALEDRAYRVSKDLYGHTPRAERSLGAA